MVPEDLLELLLQQLALNPTATKFVRDVYREVLREIRNLQSCINFSGNSDCDSTKSAPGLHEIENVTENLRRVIDFFNTADIDKAQFLSIFPEWEIQRKNNIQHLRDIAESIHKSRKLCSAAQIVGGSISVVGGAAVIGALLFPPALPAVLPLWLGGAAISSSLAIGGGIAAGAGGAAQVATSVTEATLLHKRIEKAKGICKQDYDSFDDMVAWFRRTQELETVLGNLFGMDILDIIFKDLKVFCGLEDFGSSVFRKALKACVGKIFTLNDFGFRQEPQLQAAVTAVVFVVFLVQRQNRCLFHCVVLTHRLGFGLMAGLDANVQVGRLVASTFVKNKAVGELIPKALARRVAVGTLTGIGMALDAANIVLNSIDLANGSKSEEQKKISDAADKLHEDLVSVRDVYIQLRYND